MSVCADILDNTFFCVHSNKMVKHNSTLVPQLFPKIHKVDSNAKTRMTGICTVPIQEFTSSHCSVFYCLNLQMVKDDKTVLTLFAVKNTGGRM
jgi:hypothetical protein